MEFHNKVALVTGAGSGIGRASALRLARGGARVMALSRTQEEIDQTRDAIIQAGGQAMAVTADVSNEDDMRRTVEQALASYGRIDIVIANAGINGVWAPIDELTAAEWDQTMNVNLRGTYLTLHHTVPALKKQGGAIVIVSSINGNRTFTSAGATAYSASKAAQVAMTKQLALELGKDGIRVNAVCPGAIDTEIAASTEKRNVAAVTIPVEFPEGDIPLTRGQAGKSDDVADVIAFLVSDAARHVTGAPVYIDGGQSLLR